MTAAKTGIVAEFETGYLQREVRILATVVGGTDKGLRDESTGFATRRLVKISSPDSNGIRTVGVSTASATSIGDATHIIAQSDDSTRDMNDDYNFVERYTTMNNLVVKNSTEPKTVAVYKIINTDDIKLINLSA